MRGRTNLVTALLLTVALGAPLHAQPPDAAQAVFRRAVFDFELGRVVEAAEGFDQVASMLPDQAAQLWQRGIALYYAARYDDCRAQFESHRTVNPNDVENAAWHFLCVARAESPEAAKAALLPVGSDQRAPMAQIRQMLEGALPPAQVLAAAGDDAAAQFYAHLYLGLYFEALGNAGSAREHIELAAADRYSRVGGYMHMVARVHLRTLEGS